MPKPNPKAMADLIREQIADGEAQLAELDETLVVARRQSREQAAAAERQIEGLTRQRQAVADLLARCRAAVEPQE